MMRVWTMLAGLAAALALAGNAGAAPLDPTLQQQLLGIFDGYNQALTAGKLDAAIALRSAKTRQEAKAELKTTNDRKEALASLRAMIPQSVRVLHAKGNAGGDKADIMTVATIVVPAGMQMPGAPPPGSTVHQGIDLAFVREGAAWKLDDLLFMQDPSAVTACKDESNEPATAYDSGRNVSAGGPIVRVEFKPDYTLIVFSVVGDGNCAFLPPKAELVRQGVDPAKLVPFAIVELEGNPHKSDDRKMLAKTVSILPED